MSPDPIPLKNLFKTNNSPGTNIDNATFEILGLTIMHIAIANT